MTHEEFTEQKNNIDKELDAIDAKYEEQIDALRRQQRNEREPLEKQSMQLRQQYIESRQIKVGDVVMAKHYYGFNKWELQECKVTKATCHFDKVSYDGVVRNKSGNWGTREALLYDIQPIQQVTETEGR